MSENQRGNPKGLYKVSDKVTGQSGTDDDWGHGTPDPIRPAPNSGGQSTGTAYTFLLALLILPKLQETATKFNVHPRLSIVTSELHILTKFPERNAEKIFETMSSKDTADMPDR